MQNMGMFIIGKTTTYTICFDGVTIATTTLSNQYLNYRTRVCERMSVIVARISEHKGITKLCRR